MDRDGTVSSVHYDDVYHSRSGAIAQARHVFLDGNGLLGATPRWHGRDCFTILETGFGVGINFLATWDAWRQSGQQGRLHFVSIEKHPVARDDLAKLLSAHAELQPLAQRLLHEWPLPFAGLHRLHFDEDRITLTLVFGDAMALVPQLSLQADALFLDGFSPAKNPDMWSPRLLGAISRLCRDQATLASWCVAGEVRRNLGYRGWQLTRAPGFATKPQMLIGTLQRPASAVPPAPTSRHRHAVVLGAGMAGCSISERLCSRGWQVTLIDRHSGPAQEASGNPTGILLPRLALDDALAARLARSAFFYALQTLQRLGNQHVLWNACGVVQVARDETDETYQRQVIQQLGLPADFAQFLEQATASEQVGLPLARGGWWFPSGAWVAPATYCSALLARAADRLITRFNTRIVRLQRHGSGWQALDDQGHVIADAPHLILANAQAANDLIPDGIATQLPIESIRGQVSFLPAGALANVRRVVCGAAYLTPAAGRFACVGATFDRDDSDGSVRPEDHRRNLAALMAMLTDPSTLAGIPPESLHGRTGFRCMSRDKLPLVGTLAATGAATSHSASLATLPRTNGLHTLTGLGARGFLWAPLGAELLACQLSSEPLPVERTLIDALDPARFTLRAQRGR